MNTSYQQCLAQSMINSHLTCFSCDGFAFLVCVASVLPFLFLKPVYKMLVMYTVFCLPSNIYAHGIRDANATSGDGIRDVCCLCSFRRRPVLARSRESALSVSRDLAVAQCQHRVIQATLQLCLCQARTNRRNLVQCLQIFTIAHCLASG